MEMTDTLQRHRVALVRDSAPAFPAEMPTQMLDPKDAAAILGWLLADEPQEVSIVLVLNRKHRIRGYQEVGRGGIAHSPMEAREIMQAALLGNAAAIIIAHNHPSGDPEPSQDDIAVTARIRRAGEIIGIDVLDHIIIGERGRFVSLAGRGWT